MALLDFLPLAGALCFILCAALVFAVNNALLLATDRFHIRFVEYDQNILPNLVFWPSVLTAFLIVTLVLFYGP